MMAKSWQIERLHKVFRKLKGVDAVFLINAGSTDPNFSYLTDFTNGLFEDSLIVATQNKVHLMISPLEYEEALLQKTSHMSIFNNKGNGDNARKWLSSKIKGKNIGINASFLPVGAYQRLKARYAPKKMIDVSKQLLEARMTKDTIEISRIKKAARITKTAMHEIQKYFKAGVTELELAARFDFIQMSLGASGTAFETIVCFGKNAALPHHYPDGTKLRKGDFVLIDAGSKIGNYCSDISRTFIFGNAKDCKQSEMLKIVKEAQKRAIDAIKPNLTGNKVHETAEGYINNAANGKYKGTFIHALGHSVGLEVHDGPGFSREKNKIEQGMVITVEPGIYLPGFGGVRIEDDVLITANGCEVL